LPEDVLHGLFDVGTTLMAVTPGYAPIGLAALAQAVEDLREATRTADKAKLAALTASEPSYDHSDTRVQKQTEFINGTVNRKMIIKSLEVAGDTGVARHLYVSQIDADGKITDTKIGTLQVWQKQGEAPIAARPPGCQAGVS